MRLPRWKRRRKGLTATGRGTKRRPLVARGTAAGKKTTKPPVVSQPGAYIAPARRPKERDVPSGYMVLTDEQMKGLGGAAYSVGTDETGRRIVPVDWYTKQRALGRGEAVRAPGILPAPGEPSAELTEGERVRQRAYGQRRLELEQPHGALLGETRIPETGTERGRAVRALAAERGIGIPEASQIYDTERRTARRAQRDRAKEIRRLIRREGISYAQASARYTSQYGAPAAMGPERAWSGPPMMTGAFGEEGRMDIAAGEIPRGEPEAATPRQAMEAQFTEFARPLQTGQRSWVDFAMQIDPAAVAGERADDPVIATQIKRINHLRDAVINGTAPPEEAGREIMKLMRQIASDEPFEEAVSEQQALDYLEGFDMAEWVPAGQLAPADIQRVNAMAAQIRERVADGDMTAKEGWERLQDVVDTFAEMEPTEVEEPEEAKPYGELGAKPGQLEKAVDRLLGHERQLGEEGPQKRDGEYGYNYPGDAVRHGKWIEKGEIVDGKKVKRGYWRERTEEEIAERLENRYRDFVGGFEGLGVSREAIDAQWRLGLYQYDFMEIWEKHDLGKEAEDLVDSITVRLDAGEGLDDILSSVDASELTDEELLSLDEYARGLP